MESRDFKNLVESYYNMYETSEETISEGEMEQEAQVEKYRKASVHRERQEKAERERPKPQSRKPQPKLGYDAKGYKGGALESVETEAEMLEPYDIILGHLIDEGFASSVENAEKIMSVMSDEWMQSIIEGLTDEQESRRRDLSKAINKAGTPGYPGVNDPQTRKMQGEFLRLQQLKGV